MAIQFHKRPGLVAYITCGDPDVDTAIRIILAAVEAGADVIELGVPFSDPVADGPVIQAASERALHGGTSVKDVLHVAREVRRHTDAGLIVFSYMNPLLRYGLEKFCADAANAGVDGVLVTDLPVEEAGPYLAAMSKHNLDPIFLVAPTSPDARLKLIAEHSRGFVYAVSRTGVTGTRQEVASDARDLVKRLRQFTKLPIAVGFGVSNAEQFAEVGRFADAAVIGSAIMQRVFDNPGSEPEAVKAFLRGLTSSMKPAAARKG
ncbi:tryptophan synthase, alpha chain [Candidatus Koribacter versatilis Ellin345]|uniref:Tryptophan synthase alpha chain n=1 Tax=Koribacter versatilis (strain Ellin345) TaxID=204669 RepID=Q1ISI7_KORVE|nr:tryptophan synthase subunit alpha [Candidatus Koribacter versatilis]ABF40163.1 tryptophan synthase, alpha chain [Candidatus Koribacter versatilis Ellin345]